MNNEDWSMLPPSPMKAYTDDIERNDSKVLNTVFPYVVGIALTGIEVFTHEALLLDVPIIAIIPTLAANVFAGYVMNNFFD